MYLRNLSLLHFKNIAEASIELSPHLNCFVGDNGTGKTNLLDAVHYLSVGKSVFNLSDNQCTLHEKEGFVIDGTYVTPEQRTERIVCSYKRGASKKLMRGGKEYEKLSD
ncbi:MAG: AAA family ATPase, partial [Alistipes sp.]|nr:AAA family ATPase [Alistipes sp.]